MGSLKIKTKKQGWETREQLVTRFPLTFSPKGNPKRPLKIGIYADIIARCPDLARRRIRQALWDYCNGPSYLAALTLHSYRYDLDGNPCEAVLPQHVAEAANVLRVKPDTVRSKWIELTAASTEGR